VTADTKHSDNQDIFTGDGIREMLVELLNGWRRDRAEGQTFAAKQHAAKVGTVYALTAHAHKLAYAVLELLNAGFTIEAIPTIRAAYEAALTASWVAQIDDALPAYLSRNHGQQKALRDSLQKTGWPGAEKIDIPADALGPYLVSAGSKNGARKTEDLCGDFYNGHEMYPVYRGLSWMTHPTAAVTDLYLELKPGSDIPTLHTTAHVETERDLMVIWVHILCSSLVWSARALNFIDDQRAKTEDRRRLRDAAKQLRIAEYLRVTEDAKFRGARAERQRARTMPND